MSRPGAWKRQKLAGRELNAIGRPRIRVVLAFADGREHALEAYCELNHANVYDRLRFSAGMIMRAVAFGRDLQAHDLCGQERPEALRLLRVEIGYQSQYDTTRWAPAWRCTPCC